MDVNERRLWAWIEALGRITDPARPHTRRSFTPLFLDGRRWLADRFAEAGLDTRIDAGGNLIGRREGSEPGLPALVIGSHSDTVDSGGRFDGVAGVLAGLEVATALAGSGTRPRHPLEIVDFLAEEPSVFGWSCVGSRTWAGTLPASALEARDGDGETLAEAIARMGGDPTRLDRPLRGEDDIAAYLELHIEQGPVLESRNIPIGVVNGIVGIVRMDAVFTGRADHAGATPMAMRRDAMVGAARLADAIHTLAREGAGEEYLVATVGRVAVTPNAYNVVPGRVLLGFEFRSGSEAVLADYEAKVRSRAAAIAEALDLKVAFTVISRARPARCAELTREAIADACADAGLATLPIHSGAGHDAMHVAQLAPMGMVFIPCRGGRSHCPDEWVEPAALAAGAEAILGAVRLLDRRLG